MKYESHIAEMIHEMAIREFQLGLITEADMREYDEACLPEEAFREKYAQDKAAHETANAERDLATV
jgi:DNA-binding transcriptional regulator YiaG